MIELRIKSAFKVDLEFCFGKMNTTQAREEFSEFVPTRTLSKC